VFAFGYLGMTIVATTEPALPVLIFNVERCMRGPHAQRGVRAFELDVGR